MKAVLYDRFGGPLRVAAVPDPVPESDGAVLRVRASGICRSDWHGWRGRDPDIRRFPHVPGHEFAGVVEAVGSGVSRWKPGARVTAPFACGCGSCPECLSGNSQVCGFQTQPGFTHWGSFAEFVLVRNADANLVRLPEDVDFTAAASLGCRFATSFRAVVAQGAVSSGEWVAVHGCGGVGLSAVMIAKAAGARVVGVDVSEGALRLARSLGADATVDANAVADVPAAVVEATGGGAHLSIDALGSAKTCSDSVLCLRRRGRHVQVGLLVGEDHRPRVPMERVISWELRLAGSHGMAAAKYGELLAWIAQGRLDPKRLVGRAVSLDQAPAELEAMGSARPAGIAVIDRL
jgi:alcohol dehydrogenase